MVSPVDTSVKWARSTMPGAPVLTRAAGSLIALLDALCVDGWGAQTAASVVVSGGFAEATFPADHAAAPHAVVLVSGVTGALANLNGEQKVTSVASNKIRWVTALPDGTAAGPVVVKMAAAGWVKPFSGTNLAVYRSASAQAHGQFLRVNDAAAGVARAVGYENMTGISAGSGAFPTNAQISGGYYWKKSESTTGTTPVPWGFASDGRTFYLFPQPVLQEFGPEYIACSMLGFGDLSAEKLSGDPFATAVWGGPVETIGEHVLGSMLKGGFNGNTAVARSSAGTGTAVRGFVGPLFDGEAIYPNKVTGAFTGSPCYYQDFADEDIRAWLPGVLRSREQFTERAGIAPFGIIGGSGPQRAQLYIPAGGNMAATQMLRACLVDITGPWR